MAIKTARKTTILKTVFSNFINISIAALIIKKATAHLIPEKAYATYLFAIKASKNKEIIKMIIKDGKTTPKVAKKAPKIFFLLLDQDILITFPSNEYPRAFEKNSIK